MPQNICYSCIEFLKLFYSFRSQALKAETQFKNHFLFKIKVEDEKVEEFKNEFNECFDTYDSYMYGSPIPKKEMEKKQYVCSKCKKQYTSERKFLQHLSSHDAVPVSCPICNKSFQKQSSLDKHLAKHDEQQKCAICNLTFNSEPLLMEHMVTHTEIKAEIGTEENAFTCLICHVAFNSLRSLAMHKKKHKNKEKQPAIFICDVCKKEFKAKPLLTRHLKLHSKVRPFQCPKCPKKYSRSDQLDVHLAQHNELKKNMCPYCNKGRL